ncbi:fibronectin type III domain-containing protein [Novosphingobium sp. MBES04]|uniref:fibronectin type III domain-containing protein n=1 Tax=Novosphingobium sp. MBES04 TaxID=1206458 RepID=UPI00057EF9A0|nr:fibronectin type III domain-containing protein [Novosphingobium sp. MBES04]GAM04798.1 hypothetical conserved protein [Novosphingobium sp. MBES04]
MPQAVALAIIGATGATGIAAAAITVAVYVGFTVGLNYLMSALFSPGRPKPSDGQVVFSGSAESRRGHIGIVHTGGLQSFKDSIDGTLGMVVTLGTGQEGNILQHRIHDQVVTLDGSGTITEERFRGAVHIYTRSGSDTQTSISQLTAKFPKWTSNHRQLGCAHAAIICDPVKQEYFSEVYNGREPVYTQVREGWFLYDPRQDSTAVIYDDGEGFTVLGTGPQRIDDRSTWAWSDNAAIAIANYVAHEDGYGLGYDNVNWTNIAGEADVSDENVMTVLGDTIARWRIWASWSLGGDERKKVLSDMLQACDGFCWQGPDFKFNLKVGAYEEPDITITDDHIRAARTALGPTAQQRVSALKVLYTEASIGYREQESATIQVPDADLDANTDPSAVELYCAPHHNQAARIGKLQASRLGERWHLDLTLNLFGLNLFGRQFCRVKSAILDIDAIFKLDDGVKLNISKKGTSIGAAMVEVEAGDWAFDASTEEGTPPITPDTSTTPVTIPVPTGLTLNTVQVVTAAGNGVAIEASWDAGRPDLAYQVRYRPVSGGTWVMMSVDNDALTARSGIVDNAEEYEVQILAVTISYRRSEWSASVTITPAATNTIAAPTNLSATGGTGEAEVTFRMPTSTSLAFARLYHADSSDFGTASQVGADIVGGLGEVITVTDSGLSSGTQFYWARAYDGSGGSSSLVGPESATIS